MLDTHTITALCMERQHLINKATESEYLPLYRDMQPGQNVYWCGFGDPPSLSFRAAFDDIEFNRTRQAERALIKGRFQGGNLGWIAKEDLELFAAVYRKKLNAPTIEQEALLTLVEREGPMNIQVVKEMTGMLVKEITPILHRLQEAFLVYEDQYDGAWDRGWYRFSEMFPDANLEKYTRHEALKFLLKRFAYRHVRFDVKMAKSFYKLPEKKISAAASELAAEGVLTRVDDGFLLTEDIELLKSYEAQPPRIVLALHRNDFLVKSNEHWLKERFKHPGFDTLQYLLIDGAFCGAVAGSFKNGPYVLEDVTLCLSEEEAMRRKTEILEAVRAVNPRSFDALKRYNGMPM